jgi:hypothetical protein
MTDDEIRDEWAWFERISRFRERHRRACEDLSDAQILDIIKQGEREAEQADDELAARLAPFRRQPKIFLH